MNAKIKTMLVKATLVGTGVSYQTWLRPDLNGMTDEQAVNRASKMNGYFFGGASLIAGVLSALDIVRSGRLDALSEVAANDIIITAVSGAGAYFLSKYILRK